jgi:DNA-binding response OmpR family regulator
LHFKNKGGLCRGMNTKILLVEDDLDYREVIQLLLVMNGFEVVLADDGAVAIEKAKKLLPDIVLMDLMLPILSGLEVTRRIKSNAATAKIPVIVFSAHCWDFETKQQILDAGALKCLDKPLNFDSLPELIETYAFHQDQKTHNQKR